MKMYEFHPMSCNREGERGASTKHAKCTCCPYGYHIDLDFVRYCKSLELDGNAISEQDSAALRRRERRRQRQSMEVLLGLIATPANTPQYNQDENYYSQPSQTTTNSTEQQWYRAANDIPLPSRTNCIVDDALQDVVSDFERTLAHSHGKTGGGHHLNNHCSYNNVFSTNNDVTTKQNHLHLDENLMTVSSSVGNTPAALQTIREQMALSLERMRSLEEQVQTIPILQVQISVLKERNRNLIAQLIKYEKHQPVNKFITICETNSLPRNRSSSFSDITVADKVPKRDASVTCTVITRDIGVGNTYSYHSNAYTQTHNEIETITEISPPIVIQTSSKLSQTLPLSYQSIGIQFNYEPESTLHIAEKRDSGTQTLVRRYTDSSCTVKPLMYDACNGTTNQMRDIGVSTSSVSLSTVLNQSLTRSKSFNMGENQLNLTKRTRSTASQYTLDIIKLNKSIQTNPIPVVPKRAQSSQYETPLGMYHHRASQSDRLQTDTKANDTDELRVSTVSIGVEANLTTELKRSNSIPSNITPTTPVNSPSGAPNVSRIPRPSTLVSTPPEKRRLKRQITYTKISADQQQANEFKQDISTIEENSSNQFMDSSPAPKIETAKQNKTLTTEPFYLHENNYLMSDENKQRQKVQPSKEMRAAMKVVNDFLLKNSNKNVNHLKSARNIIQQEWFKISSTVNANPLDIEDYMDCIEEVSNELLHYVVNMVDNSGNTAMHYAVSHGNFDVVSILLDSKVCNINRPNAAGYTAIMLLSLAEVRSPTHSNVIRKLFQLADVNIKAKQHGQTALMLAVSHGRLDMATLLLEAGANVNIQDEDGSTALMCAAEHGHIDIVRLFLAQSDCDSSIADVDGSTALKIALEAGHRDIGVLLYAHERMTSGASPYASLHRRKTASGRSSKPASPKLPRSPIPTAPSTPKH